MPAVDQSRRRPSALSMILGQGRADALTDKTLEAVGVNDIVSILSALGGIGASPPPGYLPFQGGVRIGGRYAPRTPGLRAETLQKGDNMVDFEGNLDKAVINPSNRAYNLFNEQDEIVASANRQTYPAGREQSGSAYIPSIWVRDDYRKTPAMFDLYNLLSRSGKTPLRATFANKKLENVFNKRMQRNLGMENPKIPRSYYDEDELGEGFAGSRVPGLDPQVPVLTPNVFSSLAIPPGRQILNADLPSTRRMAPVARPAPKRKPRPEEPHAAEKARRQKTKNRSSAGRAASFNPARRSGV